MLVASFFRSLIWKWSSDNLVYVQKDSEMAQVRPNLHGSFQVADRSRSGTSWIFRLGNKEARWFIQRRAVSTVEEGLCLNLE